MKYSVLAASKKKKLLKKLKSGVSNPVLTLPPRPMTMTMENIRPAVTGENFIRDFQYPQTIRNVMRDMEIAKFKTFADRLLRDPLSPIKAFDEIDGSDYSKEGCLRWTYDHVFFNDGQERYEAADDISFDVRGHFCYRCEMARRLVELRPIAFESADISHPHPEFVGDGYTSKKWSWMDEPALRRCTLTSLDEETPETPNGEFVCELSPDLFRALITMLQTTAGYSELRETGMSYLCGGRRMYVSESENTHFKPNTDLDYQLDIVDRLRELANPRKLLDQTVEVSIVVSEINPFMMDKGEGSGYLDECFYDPRLVVNQASRIIHSMSVRLGFGPGKPMFLFVCPETIHGLIRYDIALRHLTSFPDNDIYYPAMFYGRRYVSEVIMYSVMYLMERVPGGEFSKVVDESPEEFYKIGRRVFTVQEADFFRKRLVFHKRSGRIKNYPSMIKAIRNSFVGLSTFRQ